MVRNVVQEKGKTSREESINVLGVNGLQRKESVFGLELLILLKKLHRLMMQNSWEEGNFQHGNGNGTLNQNINNASTPFDHKDTVESGAIYFGSYQGWVATHLITSKVDETHLIEDSKSLSEELLPYFQDKYWEGYLFHGSLDL
ncbi:hypothetical protein L6452_33343 [Arctium lappa]|uniref:Uncharacterized protein n=1 Tax=Arctium lappa TaxID=4217 RepID=A0ACB8YFR9_ARCLA|nr:hypothetical protein L6452_33343 [Arctium lappa]